MSNHKSNYVTVQGVINPVPAVIGSEQAGSRPSTSSDRNATPVKGLARVADRATSNNENKYDELADANAFRRSNRLARSPPGTAMGTPTGTLRHNLRQPNAGYTPGESEDGHIPNNPETPQGNAVDPSSENGLQSCGSPRQEFILKMKISEEEALSKCRNVLKKMRIAITRQRNINMDVQNGVSELDELLDVIADYRRSWKNAEKEIELSRHSRTQQEIPDAPIIQNTKKKRNASSPAEDNPGKKLRKKANDTTAVVIPTTTRSEATAARKDVTKAQRRERPKRPQNKPDAVVIKPKDGHSYADVLKNLREKINPKETEVAVQSVRKTKAGALLLIMGKGGRKDEFRDAIIGTLKEEAVVQSMKSRATVEIQDLDSLTTEDEVIGAIKNVTKCSDGDIAVRLTSTNSREQKRAFVSLLVADANMLLEKRRILIGWTYCRIRYKEEEKRCYKCFESGHMQWDCKGPDRKGMGLCIKCGQKGHKMSECRNPPKCCVCSQSKDRPTDHIPGSRSCKRTQNTNGTH